GARQWWITPPSLRAPTLELGYVDKSGKYVERHLDPRDGGLLPEVGTLGGTRFIFPFHFSLHIRWKDVGYWLVGFSAMAMLVLLVSGVVIHHRIFKDFFRFRRNERLLRSGLDLHNLTGVFALPFHFVMTLSGLIIFFAIYFPGTWQAIYGSDRAAFQRETYGGFERPAAKTPAPLASLDAMVAEARRRWNGDGPVYIGISNPGDAASVVSVHRTYDNAVPLNIDQVFFDGPTGRVLHQVTATPVVAAHRFIVGIHFVRFQRWTLRWLYFLGGIAGCVMIATGFIVWLEARRKAHAREGLRGVRVVEALTVFSVTGIIAATCAFFAINRWLPLGARVGSLDRAGIEVLGFCATWCATLIHAFVRPRASVWREQALAIVALASAAVVGNAVSTGDHLPRALGRGLWAVAGMDALLLLGAGIAWATARRLRSQGEGREA
ncbi:MAG TPA: PepSY-associated TM helix domain-containing protein, partial [Polyangia bacterium]